MYQLQETKVDYLIIGGGIAGTTAAETIRKNDANGSIMIISDEPYNFYSRLMLSKPAVYLGQSTFDSLTMRKDEWYAQNRITLIAGKRAVELNAISKVVALEDSTRLQYGKLLLAIGMTPNKLPIAGEDKPGVFYLRTRDDAEGIAKWISEAEKSAVVIGGGFIGLEMCEILHKAGMQVTILIREEYYWQPLLDEISGRLIEKALANGGIEVMLETSASGIVGGSGAEQVVLSDRKRIDCGMVVIGVGASVPFKWMADTGIKINRGILANEFLETSVPNVWVAGDAAEYKDVLLEETVQLGNWANAQEQGRRAGLNMVGTREPFKFVSFYNTSAFGISIAFVGDVRLGESKNVVVRGDGKDGSYARIITKDREVVGATLINRLAEMGVIRQLIERNIKVGDKEKELSDPKFDLKLLLD